MIRIVVVLLLVAVGAVMPLPAISAGLIGVGAMPEVTVHACDGPKAAPRFGAPGLYAGYLDSRKVVFAGRTERTGVVELADFSYSFPVTGLWLGGAQKVRLSDSYDLVINGSYLVPANRDATEEVLLPTGVRPVRDLKTSIQWWTAGFAIISKKFGSVHPVAGFTYDAFSVGFSTSNPGTLGIGSDEADLAVTGFIPYLGLIIEQGQLAGGNLTVGAAAFPASPAYVKWSATYNGVEHNWTDGVIARGYYVQVAADYKLDFGQGRAGLFASWSLMHSWGAPSNRAENAVVTPGITYSNTFHTSFDRQAWIVGASFDLAFSTPF